MFLIDILIDRKSIKSNNSLSNKYDSNIFYISIVSQVSINNRICGWYSLIFQALAHWERMSMEYNVFGWYELAKDRYHVKETIALPDSKDCGLFEAILGQYFT